MLLKMFVKFNEPDCDNVPYFTVPYGRYPSHIQFYPKRQILINNNASWMFLCLRIRDGQP